jgi:hypothetical protein
MTWVVRYETSEGQFFTSHFAEKEDAYEFFKARRYNKPDLIVNIPDNTGYWNPDWADEDEE